MRWVWSRRPDQISTPDGAYIVLRSEQDGLPTVYLAWGPEGSQDVSEMRERVAQELWTSRRQRVEPTEVLMLGGRQGLGAFESAKAAQLACKAHRDEGSA